ncbi:DUF262 domain-containing protein [Halomonas sp. TBZ9]|uniref:DUF262 domain-containing protein n=1 Tax=Vreelandella azerica TaxID=2732867 RepID=A0A7Y3X8F2_9GAMM|nr:DUF262 domain-containing protein [Halomonas azerica]NOG30567.1 DUF262 domain-containing protein [Halomonas azerica]
MRVEQINISNILTKCFNGNFQIPDFQRGFVWSPAQIKQLAISFVKNYPMGLITAWEQPEIAHHVSGGKLEIGTAANPTKYGSYEQAPAVVNMVLDGRQRLTALAILFGGLRNSNNNMKFSGYWFFDLDKIQSDADDEEYVVYKKKYEYEQEQLDSLSNCIRRGLINISQLDLAGDYNGGIYNPENYPDGVVPDNKVCQRRIRSITLLQQRYAQFDIPVALLSSNLDLGAVCEIFDILNTTGTKVSTFDLIHNNLFMKSNGAYNLRESFNYLAELQSVGYLVSEKRQEFMCQIATGCFLSMPPDYVNAHTQGTGFAKTLKGKDLLITPLEFYNEIFVRDNGDFLEEICRDLFSNVIGKRVSINEIPYPVQVVLYLSIRWYIRYNINEGSRAQYIFRANSLFKAFFWRNTLNSRYDQGYLTKFSSDLRKLIKIIHDTEHYDGSRYCAEANEMLDSIAPLVGFDEIKRTVLDGEIGGAHKQLLKLSLMISVTRDIVDSENLGYDTNDAAYRVQIHHIFPKGWVRDNLGNVDVSSARESYGENNFANLIPMKAHTNREWRAMSPSTAIHKKILPGMHTRIFCKPLL